MCLLTMDQRDSLRSLTIHSKMKAYDITKYQTCITNTEQYVLLKGHLLTVEGKHIITCNTLFLEVKKPKS